MAKPIVAIVGRPNVGKSTLFNKLAGHRISIVDDLPGVTRDRLYADCSWLDHEFTLIDTGGLEPDSGDIILSKIKEQADVAIDNADVILFVTDITAGVTATDMQIADILRRSGKPVLVCVNKCDRVGDVPPEFYEFYNLGLGDGLFPVSSVHGHGTGDLLDAACALFPARDGKEQDEQIIKVAIVGKPNVGKSSLLNALVGYERAIVTDIAGTTRDTIEEKIRLGKTVLRLVDTAGIHKTEDKVEKIGVDRAMEAASDAQLVIAVFDGSCELTDEDMFVIKQVRKANNGVILLNKSDKDRAVINMDAFHGIKLYEVSAKTGDGIDEFCKAVEEMFVGGPKGRTGEIITNARQAGAIGAAVEGIASAKAAMEEGLTPDCVLVGVEQAMMNIGEISGKTIREDITARIFERFCVGK